MKTALLLIAHGSRHEDANADLRHLVEQMRGRGSYAVVEGAFLELAAPSLAQGAANCVSQGVERVVLLPYFLSAGVHVERDLSGFRNAIAERYPDVEFLLADPLGRHPLLVDIVTERAQEAEARQD
jgi:sirohydrochlorin ferrochelatase